MIRPRFEGFTAMIRSLRGVVGFQVRPAPVASVRLMNAVAASLVIGSLSLCVILALTVISIQGVSATPL
jgi:hypothetical protein